MQTAVVTGAGRGFGREIARRLAQRGYAVLATDVDEQAARETAELAGASCWSMALDVRDPEAHRAAARAAAEKGELRVWVNNAGVLRTGKAWSHSDDEVNLMVGANLLGVIWGSRSAVDAMRTGGGEILNLASMSAYGPVPGLAIYAATKHSVLGFSSSLQGDLDSEGIPIRVHALCPDAANTGMVGENAADADASILFSGGLLDVDEVVDAGMAMLGTKSIVRSLPRSRGLLTRSLAPFPRVGLPIIRALGKSGDRGRRRQAP